MNSTRMVNISSLPSSMRSDIFTFANPDMKAKFAAGPTCSKPGPTLLIEAALADIAVIVGTVLDMMHKQSAKYFFEKAERAQKDAKRQLGGGEKAGLAVQTLANEVLTSSEFCNTRRRISHLLTMYGFVFFVVTFIFIFVVFVVFGVFVVPVAAVFFVFVVVSFVAIVFLSFFVFVVSFVFVVVFLSSLVHSGSMSYSKNSLWVPPPNSFRTS